MTDSAVWGMELTHPSRTVCLTHASICLAGNIKPFSPVLGFSDFS